MTLILAIIPVLLLIILMAFFKMPGDKSSIISLVVTMLIALFGFTFSVDNLFYSFLYGAASLPNLAACSNAAIARWISPFRKL